MIKKIDTNSEEFQIELELTKKFTDKVLEEHGLTYNPDSEVNESIQMGLTRNKLIYGKRYCPCFMVIGETLKNKKQVKIDFVHVSLHLQMKYHQKVMSLWNLSVLKKKLKRLLKRLIHMMQL